MSILLLFFLLSAPARAASSLFYLEPAKEACRWMSWTPEGGARELARTSVCPSEILFDKDAKRSIFVCGTALCERAWGADAKTVRLAQFPGTDDDGARLWLSAGGLRPRVARMVILEPADVAGPPEAPLYRFEGASYKAPADLPQWGEPAVVVLEELDAAGRWYRIGIYPTKTSAGDTPGLSVIPQELSEAKDAAPGVASLRRTLEQASCGAGDCEEPWRGDKAVAAGLRKPLHEDERLGWFSAGKTGTVFFTVVTGDTVHAQGPVYFCAKGCKEPQRLSGVPSGQISVSPWDGSLLITEEYSGAKPKVYKPGTAAPVFTVPTGRSAVWLDLE